MTVCSDTVQCERVGVECKKYQRSQKDKATYWVYRVFLYLNQNVDPRCYL